MDSARSRSELHRNGLSYFGALVMVVSAALIVLTALLQLLLTRTSPYLGIVIYIVFPGFFTLGLFLFLYGMRRESLRRRRTGEAGAAAYPRLDLNDPRQRRRFAFLGVTGIIASIILAFAAYNAFVFTESVTFCGQVCHRVMQPEHTAYLSSPHARVACVECHVGSGASWYAKSKLSGLRQVYATLFSTYPRPIPTPIKNLRPARETCEQCHWPEKFFGSQLLQNPHFRHDERNTAEQVSLVMKTGGGSAQLGIPGGIHWHTVIAARVQFIALDRQLQQIAVVRVTRADGTSDEYRRPGIALDEPRLKALPVHVLDCIHCHNRPSHVFNPPEREVDLALASGRLPRTLPWIKKVAVAALVRHYPDPATARRELRAAVLDAYRRQHPEVVKTAAADLERAVAAVQAIQDRTVFPAMKVDWSTYPNHLSHKYWPGCFRCHDGLHTSRSGKVLSRACDTCHTLPQRGPLTGLGTPSVGKGDWHLLPLRGKHAALLCDRCHAPGRDLSGDCASCHHVGGAGPMMKAIGCTDCHQAPGQVKPLAPCASCHDDLPGLHRKATHAATPCGDCHRAHAWKVTGRDRCLACHDDKADHHRDGGACAACHAFGAKAAPASAPARGRRGR